MNTFLCPLSSGVRVVLLSAPLRPSERGAGGGVVPTRFHPGSVQVLLSAPLRPSRARATAETPDASHSNVGSEELAPVRRLPANHRVHRESSARQRPEHHRHSRLRRYCLAHSAQKRVKLNLFRSNRRSPTEVATSRSCVALCQKGEFEPRRPSAVHGQPQKRLMPLTQTCALSFIQGLQVELYLVFIRRLT